MVRRSEEVEGHEDERDGCGSWGPLCCEGVGCAPGVCCSGGGGPPGGLCSRACLLSCVAGLVAGVPAYAGCVGLEGDGGFPTVEPS